MLAAIAGSWLAPAAAAKAPAGDDHLRFSDNLSSPLADRQAQLKAKAQELVLTGQAKPKGDNRVVKVAPGQFVELAFEGEDLILTVLGEFGNDKPTTHHGGHGGTNGPLHNQIPEPDRNVDNTTIWVEDFNQAHFDTLLYDKSFNPSMANYYLEQSSGRYSVDGFVSDWNLVPNNEATYGSNYCGSNVCADTWRFINDSADVWWDALVAQEGSVAAANAFLAQFDVWDRYDFDGDSNFDEPDGYIDHYQAVHAGMGEEVGGGAQGTDAIWSHRWYAWYPTSGIPGPDGPGPHGLAGMKIGASNFWVGDYTVEPENGGVGVFAHEFAHDLNLPDEYSSGGENSTAWWTLMSQGSYGTVNGVDLGSAPTHMSAWDKFQLGFLRPGEYQVVGPGQSGTFHLGPAEFNNKKTQAIFMVLPNNVVESPVAGPFSGDWLYYSGSGANLDNNMTRPITLGAGTNSLSFQARYQIETCWDYAYVQVSNDGGATWTNLNTSASTNLNEFGQNFGNGITGVSGQPHVCDSLQGTPEWVNVTADLTPFASQTIQLRFRYWTDPFVNPAGIAVDDIAITGQPLDDAETDPGWTYDGFTRTEALTQEFFNAYVLENRQYLGYDNALDQGPYNFGFPAAPDLVEHFPYQDGLLVWYWNNEWTDNDVNNHPGEGLILPVDAHPAIETWNEGTQMRPRIQSYDATFTKSATESITLHNLATGAATTIPSHAAASVFNDGLRDGDGTSIYWAPGHPSDAPADGNYQAEWNSVDVPNTGTTIRVKSISNTGMMVLDINK
jgi:immune inhibitor A